MGGLPHGEIIVPLISPLPGTATRASPPDNSLWRSAQSPCYGFVSAPQQNKKRAKSGEECTMLRSKWLTPFFCMTLAIACGGQALAQGALKGAYTHPLSGPVSPVGDPQ